MDSDGFAVHSRRRGYSHRDPTSDRDRATFLREVPKYAGTSEDFNKAHARRYGREEGLGPDGRHHHGSYKFPPGSDRERLYNQYDASTHGRDLARDSYNKGLTGSRKEFKRMDEEEREYYRENTGNLTPLQHEHLEPRAKEYRDKCQSNAKNRESYLRSHPHGYHSSKDQEDHHDYARDAYGEYEYARDQQTHHERYRSYSNVDKRRDQWGRPVSHR